MNNSCTYTITNDVANDVTLLMSVNIGDKENNYYILIGLHNSVTFYLPYSWKT